MASYWRDATAGYRSEYVARLRPSSERDGQWVAGVSRIVRRIADQPRLPFALETLRIVSPCTAEMVAWVRYSPDSHNAVQLDIDLCDARGNVCAQMHGLSLRVMGDRAQNTTPGRRDAAHRFRARNQNNQSAAIAEITSDDLSQKTLSYLRKELSGMLKLPSHKIDPRAALEKYGIDSILAMKLTDQLEEDVWLAPQDAVLRISNHSRFDRILHPRLTRRN